MATGAPPPLAGSALWRLGANLARVSLGLASVPLFTRALGMWQWGLLALFQAAVGPLVFLDLGVGAATVKQVAELVARGERARAARTVQTTFLFHAGVGLLGVGALMLVADPLASRVFATPAEYRGVAITGFRLVAVSWYVAFAGSSFLGVLAAHQRFDRAARLATAGTLLTTGSGIVTALASGNVLAVVVAQAAAALVMALLGFRAAASLLPELRRRPRWDPASFRRSMSFGAWQAVAVGGGLLTAWSDRYVLGVSFAPAIVGYYAVAQSLLLHLNAAFYELGEVLFPAVSHRQGAGDLAGARELSLLVGWTVTTGFGVVAVPLAVVGGDFLALWISRAAADVATVVLRLLCVGGILGASALAPSFFVLGIGRTRWHALSSVAGGLVMVATSIVLAPRLGLEGVGWGIVAGAGTRVLVTALIWRAHFADHAGLRHFALHVWAPPGTSLVLLSVLVPAHDALVHVESWPALMGEGLCVAALVALLQLASAEALPGGSARRRAVLSSFAPVLARFVGRRPPGIEGDRA